MKESAQLIELRQQLAELQSQVAFQDDAMHALDEAIATQQQETLLLRRQLELLKQRQDEMAAGQVGGEDSPATDPATEKPPHY
jgi:SlyX protein